MGKIFLFIKILTLTILCLNVKGQSPLKMRDSTIKGSQTFAIIVGVSEYKYVRPLAYADKDAELFRDYLRSPAGGGVSNDNIFFLLNEQADNANFWTKGFQWLKAKKLQKDDKLFIYLAGHGDAIDEDQFFFLGVDCNPGGDKNNYLVGGAIQLFNLKKKIAKETAKGVEVFFIMDACRSNELPGGAEGLNFLNTAITEKKAGEVIMLATGAGQESLEDASIGSGHGLFTYYLVDGLIGAADSIGKQDNKISLKEIQSYVNRNVFTVAQNRFNRVQSPFFCCDEKNEKIISVVDTAYLKNWLKEKKQSSGTGKSFSGKINSPKTKTVADTLLLEIYNSFYKSVKETTKAGRNASANYYQMLEKKYPDNPYTLDAKTTMAAAFIKFAQGKVSQYIGCGTVSTNQKAEFNEAGNRLETAIQLLSDDEPEFAGSLLGRMFFLKASGESTNSSEAFKNAYAGLALDRNAAYTNNLLAVLHFENKNTDSAIYYGKKAIASAPKWPCSYTTVSLTYKLLKLPDSASKYEKRANAKDPSLEIASIKKPGSFTKSKIQIGVKVGGGSSKFNLTLSNWDQRNTNYNDSLNSISTKNGSSFNFGIISQINFSETFSWRPAAAYSVINSDIIYDRKPGAGTILIETLALKSSSIVFESPFIYYLKSTDLSPYLTAGPSFAFQMNQSQISSTKLPLNSFEFLGNIGAGIDIGLKQSNIILTPELRFSAALNSIKGDGNNIYTNTLSSLKRQSFMFNLYIRKK